MANNFTAYLNGVFHSHLRFLAKLGKETSKSNSKRPQVLLPVCRVYLIISLFCHYFSGAMGRYMFVKLIGLSKESTSILHIF